MKLLLDTHAFLWWESEPERLSPTVLAYCADEKNQILLSVVSAWEMQIKMQLGKLKTLRSLEEMISRQKRDNRLELLSVELPHVLGLRDLPLYHRDPFDRLLIAQARVERFSIVSSDKVLSAYPVEIVW